MSNTLAKALIIGLPVAVSLAWCTYWMIRLIRAKKRIDARKTASGELRPPGGL